METKIINLTEGLKTTLYEEGDLRIHLINKVADLERLTLGELYFYNLPASEGVSIEYCYNGKNYIVICFVEPDENGKIKIRQVGSRVREYKKKHLDNILKYDKFKKLAKQFVKEALEKNGI